MGNDYFYEEQSDQFTFYRVPKVLVAEKRYSSMPSDAKLLYGLLLDRMSLSAKNSWLDGQGRIFIYYKIESIERDMGCRAQKAVKLLKILEEYDLIERTKQGQGKPTKIYVKNFIRLRKSLFKDDENQNSGIVNIKSQDFRKSSCSNTELINTEISDTNLFLSADADWEERESYSEYFKEQLGIEALKQGFPFDREIIDGILELILDVVCSKKKTIRMAGEDKSINIVKSRFMKLDSSHIEYVISSMKENTTKVCNIRQYLLAALYNAPVTIGSYYQALVNNDMATGKI